MCQLVGAGHGSWFRTNLFLFALLLLQIRIVIIYLVFMFRVFFLKHCFWKKNSYSAFNEVSFNQIHDFKTLLGDGGGIYALGPQTNSVMANNWVYNMGSGRGGGMAMISFFCYASSSFFFCLSFFLFPNESSECGKRVISWRITLQINFWKLFELNPI